MVTVTADVPGDEDDRGPRDVKRDRDLKRPRIYAR
jgi:hypothetical protein